MLEFRLQAALRGRNTIIHRLKPELQRLVIELLRTVDNTHWHQPLHMNFDSETMPKWFGLPKKENLPTTFSIEYVRSYKRINVPKRDE